MAIWLHNLRDAIETKEVILLHGNVRDMYIDDEKNVFTNLTEVIEHLLHDPRLPLQFQQWSYYDPSQEERRFTAARTSPAEATPSATPPTAGSELLPATPGGQNRARPPADRLLARWRTELSSTTSNTLAVLFYLDKLVSYQPMYQENEKTILFWLSKVIENITPNNRLILVALQDTLVPVEIYNFSPKVRVVAVPMPFQTDRARYLDHRIPFTPILDVNATTEEKEKCKWVEAERYKLVRLVADLTDGLYLHDLDRIVSAIPQSWKEDIRQLRYQQNEREVRQLINKYRLGEREDYWASLSLKKLQNAENIFIHDPDFGVKGQDEAVRRVIDILAVAKAGLAGIATDNSTKPKGVQFFVGPSGVGKTFLAKKIARFLFGTEEAFFRYDMSEYKEEHTVSKLIGSPPGYVGYEQGGRLTNDVRNRPFSVILFDEVEKAHPKIMDIFLQVLDDGRLTDSRGQTVFFTEAVIIFTSNLGTRTVDSRGNPIPERDKLDALLRQVDEARHLGESLAPVEKKIADHFVQSVRRFFSEEISRPELLNRVGNNILPFNFIDSRPIQEAIVRGHLQKIVRRYEDMYRDRGLSVDFDSNVIEYFVSQYGEQISEFGGRAVANLIQDQLIPMLARFTLESLEAPDRPEKVLFRISAGGGKVTLKPGVGS